MINLEIAIRRLASKGRTAVALGLPNIADVTVYRFRLRLGIHPAQWLRATTPSGNFFSPPARGKNAESPAASSEWKNSALLFCRWPLQLQEGPPDWLADPLSGQRMSDPHRNWWQIPDFNPRTGDIKRYWELSRMTWVIAFAQQALSGDANAVTRLNTWLTDWSGANPPYRGPNWKCGQEASIRVMHLAMAAFLLDQVRTPSEALIDLLALHLRRIAPTMRYAVAQDNNHGTSEAAALFIGGSWLARLGRSEGRSWERRGRLWLEERAARLIGEQGTFSQYSTNYHRVMLDTLCMVEVWRRHLALPAFSPTFVHRAQAASRWLYHVVDESCGDAPNVGANDGARLLQLGNTLYRDFRPTVQMAMALFAGERAYDSEGSWNTPLRWLGISTPDRPTARSTHFIADDGGFLVLRRGAATVLKRYPRFRFRPSQADALHLDLWLGGENLLRDGGSFGYNTEPELQDYFPGTASHNTVQFDDRDQMPRLGRFLFGEWLKTNSLEALRDEDGAAHFGARYRDWLGAEHMRRISLSQARLEVEDVVSGFKSKAVLRWRLAPGDWHLELTVDGCIVRRSGELPVALRVTCPPVAIRECRMVQGWESRHYLEKTALPVLEIEVRDATRINTIVSWSE